MNGKTAKLIKRYSLLTGHAERLLKREWLALTSSQRFHRRQSMITELQEKK